MAIALTPQQWLNSICGAGETCDMPTCESAIVEYHRLKPIGNWNVRRVFDERMNSSTTQPVFSKTFTKGRGPNQLPAEVSAAVCADVCIAIGPDLIPYAVQPSDTSFRVYYHTALFKGLLKVADSFTFYLITKTGQDPDIILSVSPANAGDTNYFDLSSTIPPNPQSKMDMITHNLQAPDEAETPSETDRDEEQRLTITKERVAAICGSAQCTDPACELAIAAYHRKTLPDFTKLINTAFRVKAYSSAEIAIEMKKAADCMNFTVNVGATMSFNVVPKAASLFPAFFEVALFNGLLKTNPEWFVFYLAEHNDEEHVIFTVHRGNNVDYFDLSSTIPPLTP